MGEVFEDVGNILKIGVTPFWELGNTSGGFNGQDAMNLVGTLAGGLPVGQGGEAAAGIGSTPGIFGSDPGATSFFENFDTGEFGMLQGPGAFNPEMLPPPLPAGSQELLPGHFIGEPYNGMNAGDALLGGVGGFDIRGTPPGGSAPAGELMGPPDPKAFMSPETSQKLMQLIQGYQLSRGFMPGQGQQTFEESYDPFDTLRKLQAQQAADKQRAILASLPRNVADAASRGLSGASPEFYADMTGLEDEELLKPYYSPYEV